MLRCFWLLACGCLAASCATWTELGPRGAGRVSAIVATDVNHVWVATPGGGVWKSTDGGVNFTWAGNYGLGDFTAVNLALDRNNPSRMYLRTWSGLLVSTDEGAHWTRTLYSLPQGDTPYPYPSYACGTWPACPPFSQAIQEPGPFAQMVFSKTESVIITSLPCQGLQHSLDGGSHFTQLWPFPSPAQQRDPRNCLNAITVDESTHQVWIATMDAGGTGSIYRSREAWTAAGPPSTLHWDQINAGLPVGGQRTGLALAWGGSANRVMAIVEIGGVNNAFLFDGTSWIAKPWPSTGCEFRDVRTLVWGGGNDFFAGAVTFAYTNNAGDSWTCPPLGAQYPDIRAIYASPTLGHVWIGGDQNALGSSHLMTRYGWTPGSVPSAPVGLPARGISSWQAYTIAQGEASSRILVGAQDIGSACSDDLGLFNLALVPTEEMASIVWPRGGGGDTAYLYSTLGTMLKSTNARSARRCADVRFTAISPPERMRRAYANAAPHLVAVQPNDTSRVFILSLGYVLYSTNGGGSWQETRFPIAGPGERGLGLTAIMVDEDGVVYVGTQDHGVYTCSDTAHYCDGSPGAGTWAPFALNAAPGFAPPAFVTAIAQSNPPPAPRNFWIATSQGLYRRLAGSTTWSAVNLTPSYPYSDVVVDPTCRTRIYTGIGYLGSVTRTRGGIDYSTDNGATWRSLTAGHPLHNVPVTQVLIDTAQPERIFASTYGRGAWLWVWRSLPPCTP